MKKILLIIVCCIFLTGCANVTYNLEIKKNLSVEEKVNMSATKEYFDTFYMNLPVTIVKEIYDNNEWMAPLKNEHYNIEFRKDNTPYPSIFASKKYVTIEEYIVNTAYQKQLFEEINVSKDNNLITISTKKLLEYRPDDSNGGIGNDSRAPISNLSINIKLPFVVTKSNADKVDKSTNTYTWKITDKTENKEINITFDKSKMYIYNITWYISLIIIIILAIIATIYIIKMIKKNKNNNLVN